MRRLVLFLALVVVLLAAGAAFDWWVDPFGEVWKPDVFAAARKHHCLVSQELVGSRYYDFKRDVFFHRPTRTFVVGSSRVLKLAARPGEDSFSNLGYPGTAPETILRLFRSLPAKPAQTVYVGVEAFWFNTRYALPATDLSWYRELEYLLSRHTFARAVSLSHQSAQLPWRRWRQVEFANRCVLTRFNFSILWRTDGSRIWGWELDPSQPRFSGGAFHGNLATWRNGYYADWAWDEHRVHVLEQALDVAKRRGWHVVGFAPPEPSSALTELQRLPNWSTFETRIPQLFTARGFTWAKPVTCPTSWFPDLFHSDARCALRIRRALTAAR